MRVDSLSRINVSSNIYIFISLFYSSFFYKFTTLHLSLTILRGDLTSLIVYCSRDIRSYDNRVHRCTVRVGGVRPPLWHWETQRHSACVWPRHQHACTPSTVWPSSEQRYIHTHIHIYTYAYTHMHSTRLFRVIIWEISNFIWLYWL